MDKPEEVSSAMKLLLASAQLDQHLNLAKHQEHATHKKKKNKIKVYLKLALIILFYKKIWTVLNSWTE